MLPSTYFALPTIFIFWLHSFFSLYIRPLFHATFPRPQIPHPPKPPTHSPTLLSHSVQSSPHVDTVHHPSIQHHQPSITHTLTLAHQTVYHLSFPPSTLHRRLIHSTHWHTGTRPWHPPGTFHSFHPMLHLTHSSHARIVHMDSLRHLPYAHRCRLPLHNHFTKQTYPHNFFASLGSLTSICNVPHVRSWRRHFLSSFPRTFCKYCQRVRKLYVASQKWLQYIFNFLPNNEKTRRWRSTQAYRAELDPSLLAHQTCLTFSGFSKRTQKSHRTCVWAIYRDF